MTEKPGLGANLPLSARVRSLELDVRRLKQHRPATSDNDYHRWVGDVVKATLVTGEVVTGTLREVNRFTVFIESEQGLVSYNKGQIVKMKCLKRLK